MATTIAAAIVDVVAWHMVLSVETAARIWLRQQAGRSTAQLLSERGTQRHSQGDEVE
jgi:hypothetical protein